MRIGIYGYGNLGRGVECAITKNPDMTLSAVFTRRDPAALHIATAGVPVDAGIGNSLENTGGSTLGKDHTFAYDGDHGKAVFHLQNIRMEALGDLIHDGLAHGI